MEVGAVSSASQFSASTPRGDRDAQKRLFRVLSFRYGKSAQEAGGRRGEEKVCGVGWWCGHDVTAMSLSIPLHACIQNG